MYKTNQHNITNSSGGNRSTLQPVVTNQHNILQPVVTDHNSTQLPRVTNSTHGTKNGGGSAHIVQRMVVVVVHKIHNHCHHWQHTYFMNKWTNGRSETRNEHSTSSTYISSRYVCASLCVAARDTRRPAEAPICVCE